MKKKDLDYPEQSTTIHDSRDHTTKKLPKLYNVLGDPQIV